MSCICSSSLCFLYYFTFCDYICEQDAWWNAELLEFYIAYFCPTYELYYFIEFQKYWVLAGSFKFATAPGDKKKIFIGERSDRHCKAMTTLHGHHDVSTSHLGIYIFINDLYLFILPQYIMLFALYYAIRIIYCY